MNYISTRDGVFAGAAIASRDRVPVVVTTRLVKREELERAFREWQETGNRGVEMRITTTVNGDLAAEFTPVDE